MSTASGAPSGWQAEAQRQQALWAALQAADGRPAACPAGAVAWRGPAGSADASDGVRAGRAHAQACAWRAVCARYPVLAEWLGEEATQALARDLWRAHPPRVGDLARFGDEAPGLIAAQPDLAAWPWLADLARLEAAVHAARTAPDAPADVLARGMAPLAHGDPASWRLRLAPGSVAVAAPWPVWPVWWAHARPDRVAAERPDLGAGHPARAADADGARTVAWVWRCGWQVQVAPLDDTLVAWHGELQAGLALGQALAAQWQRDPAFDFSAWWRKALTRGWVVGCEPVDRSKEPT
ncbi:putative DNA-binding domain-containing protein [Ideonella sp.]|uniref:HvfC/BufC family peptide modification chaperone n=1 Tax=Ideonella sp. TaxID=1929293 RepID=UPI0035B0614A